MHTYTHTHTRVIVPPDRLGIPRYRSTMEADIDLAMRVARKEALAVVSLDSDFWIFPDCAYIAVDSFDFSDGRVKCVSEMKKS